MSTRGKSPFEVIYIKVDGIAAHFFMPVISQNILKLGADLVVFLCYFVLLPLYLDSL